MYDLEMRAGNEDLLHKATHSVSYEHGRARVRLSDDLDVYVLFVWQEPGAGGEDGWKYYDIQRITSASSTSTAPTPGVGVGVGVLSEVADSEEPYTRSSSPSSDAYWDNYGTSTSISFPFLPFRYSTLCGAPHLLPCFPRKTFVHTD